MLRRFLAALLTFLTLTVALAGLRLARAEAVQTISFKGLTVPSTVNAGDTAKFQVLASPYGKSVLCCGALYVKGPGKEQSFMVPLTQTSQGLLEGSLPISPNAAPGTWEITRLILEDAEEKQLTLEKSAGFNYTFTVVSTGKPVDAKPPVLIGVQMPAETVAGDIIPITAQVGDDLSGVDHAYATVSPVAEKAYWSFKVELFPTGKPTEMVGHMVADPLTTGLEITHLSLIDKAGNRVDLDKASLSNNQNNKLTASVKQREIPAGLITSPYLNLIHPGEIGYWSWLTLDRDYVLSLLQSAATDPNLVRERIAAELPQLRGAIDQLRQELYVDPATKLKVSPYATTGKWMAVDAALWARMELLTELDRAAGLTRPDRQKLTAADLDHLYAIHAQDEFLLPMENTLNTTWSQVPAAMLHVLAQAPEAVQVLRTPAHESPEYGPLDHFDRDVIYFTPIASERRYSIRWGQSSFFVTTNPAASVTIAIADLFYEAGRHFVQAYLSAWGAPDAPERWKEYLDLRGAAPWNISDGSSFTSSLESNLGDDFAYTFLPGGLSDQYFSRQSLMRLRDNPELAKRFREYIAKQLATPAPVTTITPTSLLEVGVSATFKGTITPYAAATGGHALGYRWAAGGELQETLKPVKTGETAEYTVQVPTVGRLAVFQFTGLDATRRTYNRYFYYYRAPVILDPVPGATNNPTPTISGVAAPNQRVTIGSASTLTDKDGKFRLTIPLKDGLNDLRLTVSGQPLAASFQIKYEPSRNPITLKVDLPGSTRNDRVEGMVTTEAYAIVSVKGMRGQADENGKAPFVIPLDEGANAVEITVTTVAGNTATWKGVVLRDSTPGEIKVNLPVVTNQQNFTVTGAVKPGSTLTLNDAIVPVDATGAFKQTIALTEGQATLLKFVATDAAGNRTEETRSITYTAAVPAVATTPTVTLKGKVAPGTSLSYQGQKILVGLDGSFSYDVPLNVGANSFVLSASLNGQSTGYLQFDVLLPVKATATVGADGKITVTGKTVPGYVIAVNDLLTPVEADGSFTSTLEPKGNSVVITVVAGGQVHKVEIRVP